MNDRHQAPIPELALAILCGGESQRMGVSKPLLEFGGEPMVVRMVRRLSEICGGSHFVVAAAEQVLPRLPGSVRVLRDRAPRRGPLEGVVLATEAASHQPELTAVAVVGCDLPWLEPALIHAMLDVMTDESDVVSVQDENRLHPLVAVYRPRVWQAAQLRLTSGQRSLQGLLDALNTQAVDLDFVRAIDPALRSLINVNTPADYERALRILDEK